MKKIVSVVAILSMCIITITLGYNIYFLLAENANVVKSYDKVFPGSLEDSLTSSIKETPGCSFTVKHVSTLEVQINVHLSETSKKQVIETRINATVALLLIALALCLIILFALATHL